MQGFIIQQLVSTIMTFASEEMMKRVADGILDVVEDAVEKTSNKIDDQIVLPLCRKARDVFDIEDND